MSNCIFEGGKRSHKQLDGLDRMMDYMEHRDLEIDQHEDKLIEKMDGWFGSK